jgi:hypothetical protein
MPDVPTACLPLVTELEDKQDEYDALKLDLAAEKNTDMKSFIKKQMANVQSKIDELKIQLRACAITNGPQPDPATTPSLSVAGIEVVQSIQSVDNRIPIVDGPAVVRVSVDSGIRNNYNAGEGPNAWPGVRGALTVRDVVTGQVVMASGPFPSQVTARQAEELHRNNTAQSLNFLIGIPVGSANLTIKADVWVDKHRGSGGGWEASRSVSLQIEPPKTQEITPVLVALPLEGDFIGPSMEQFAATHTADAVPMFRSLRFQIHPALRLTALYTLHNVNEWRVLLAQLMAVNIASSTPQGGVRACLINFPASGGGGTWGVGLGRIAWMGPTFLCVPDSSTYAHEFGHAMGELHARCGTDNDVDDSIPPRTSEPGWRIPAAGGLGSVVPQFTPDLMSYCRPQWPGTTTYLRVTNRAPNS